MLTALLFLSAAFAVDLDLTVTLPEGSRVDMSVPDVALGELKPVTLQGADGKTWRFSGTLSEFPGENYELKCRLETIKGRRTELVAAPTQQAAPGAWAEFFAGGEVPIPGTDPLLFAERGVRIVWRVTPSS